MRQERSDRAGPVSAPEPAPGLRAAGLAASGLRLRLWAMRSFQADPEMMLFAAKVGVLGRWFVLLIGAVEVAYRPALGFPSDWEYLLLGAPLLAFNGPLHHRLLSGRTVTWPWLLILGAVDVALITGAVIIGGEFHLFVYMAYYPALALFAAVFPSPGLCLVWTTVVAALYTVVSLAVSGLDLDAGQKKALLARVAAMYAVALGVSLITRFERFRGMRAEAERSGGGLVVESGGLGQGTAVTCWAPYDYPSGGGRYVCFAAHQGDGGGRPSHYEERPAGRPGGRAGL